MTSDGNFMPKSLQNEITLVNHGTVPEFGFKNGRNELSATEYPGVDTGFDIISISFKNYTQTISAKTPWNTYIFC